MRQILVTLLIVLAGFSAAAQSAPVSTSLAQDSRCFEMRTYYAAPGKFEALHARFREQTIKIFERHGMQVIAFWVPIGKDGKHENKLIYILAYPSRLARDNDWKEFSADPVWKAVQASSEANGRLVEKSESLFLTATDYSPLK